MEELKNLEDRYAKIMESEFNIETRVVFGDGNINADIMLIGEAPGEKEEETGRAFVGAAGKNLDEFLDILQIKRQDIYITNVVKIRPYRINPDTGRKSNRPPNKREIELSMDTLKKQIEIINPDVIVTLGNVPLKAILEDDRAKIGDYHGKAVKLGQFTLFPLYHPASIIYNRSLHEVYIEDVNKLKNYISNS